MLGSSVYYFDSEPLQSVQRIHTSILSLDPWLQKLGEDMTKSSIPYPYPLIKLTLLAFTGVYPEDPFSGRLFVG